MASGVNGRWMLVSSDGFADYMSAIGVSAAMAKKASSVLEVTGDAGPKEEFSYDGSSLTRRVIKGDGTVHSDDTTQLGSETSGKAIDGRDIKVTMSASGNKILRDESGAGYTAHWERVIDGDNMTLTMTAGGTTCTRKFQRV